MSTDEGVEANLGAPITEGRVSEMEGIAVDIIDDDISIQNDPLGEILDDSVNESEVESLNADALAALKATLEAIKTGKDDVVLKDIAVPTMGQLVKANGTDAIISGGQPKKIGQVSCTQQVLIVLHCN